MSRGNPTDLFVKVGDQLFIECVTCHDQHTHYQENNPYNDPNTAATVGVILCE